MKRILIFLDIIFCLGGCYGQSIDSLVGLWGGCQVPNAVQVKETFTALKAGSGGTFLPSHLIQADGSGALTSASPVFIDSSLIVSNTFGIFTRDLLGVQMGFYNSIGAGRVWSAGIKFTQTGGGYYSADTTQTVMGYVTKQLSFKQNMSFDKVGCRIFNAFDKTKKVAQFGNNANQYDVFLGDISNNENLVYQYIRPSIATISENLGLLADSSGVFQVTDGNDSHYMQITPRGYAVIGDIDGAFSGSNLMVDFQHDKIKLRAVHTNMQSLHAYANNAAALSAGLTTGDLYFTDTGGEYIIKWVH